MRKIFILITILAAIIIMTVCSQSPQEPSYELRDGGFESGTINGWFTETEDDNFTFSLSRDAFEGQYSLTLTNMGEDEEARSIKKIFSEYPPHSRYFKLSTQAKMTGKAHIAVLSEIGDDAKALASTKHQDPVPADGNWHNWEVKFFVPPGSEKLTVQCSVHGSCKVNIDSMRIEEIEREAGIRAILDSPGIACAQGADNYIATKNVEKYESVFPLPIIGKYQTPISFYLEVDPPEKLISSEISHRMGDNWVCKVVFGPMKKDEMVKVLYSSDVIMGSTDFSSFPKTASIPARESYPERVRAWLEPTISAQSDHPKIINEAKRLMEISGEENAVSFIRTMLDSITSIKFQKPKGCDAVSMLEQGGACTSHANLGAALCRVAGIPARVVANYPVWNVAMQTHYIIETWIEGFGWVPVETSMNRFPQDPFRQVYVSLVQIQDEQDSFDKNRFAAGGVPKWSLNERDTRPGVMTNYDEPLLNQIFCDHMSYPVIQFAAYADLSEILELGKMAWTAYQEAKTEEKDNPDLVAAIETRLNPAPRTVKELLEHMKRLEAFLK